MKIGTRVELTDTEDMSAKRGARGVVTGETRNGYILVVWESRDKKVNGQNDGAYWSGAFRIVELSEMEAI